MPKPPWSQPRGADSVVSQWFADEALRSCFTARHHSAPRAAELAPLPQDLAPGLRAALAQRGIESLYRHQAEAISAARAGRHVVVATPTASGKSLTFHLPVLQALHEDPGACALFLYPTKALSRDQEHALRQLAADAGLNAPAIVFDGDTPADARRSARESGRIILTNPDMLHSGILPNHPGWARVLQGLRYVVLDELHTYRGVFGSHMSHVLARLRRLARFHGSEPTNICATATIGNPRQHAARLLGVEEDSLTLVEHSGAASPGRQFLLFNPPVVNAELGIRASALKRAVHLAADLVRAKVPTLVFGPSRNSVEVMLKYLREAVAPGVGPEAVMAYRGGYLPEQRRSVERGLREGRILGVVATNALELGIDIGDLQAVVCVGYPGSVAGLWQRFGRAGRRDQQALAVLVCSSDAVDQFLAGDPEYLLNAGAEEARIDPGNVEIVIQHLKCAAFEAPFELSSAGPQPAHPQRAAGEGYSVLSPEETRDALQYLGQHGLIHENQGRFHWTGEAFPANNVSLRSIGWDNFVIIDVQSNRTLAELDWRAAHTMLHEQAIYQHDAEQYQVERLDFENHKAFVRKVEPDYFTTALTYRTVGVLDENERRPLGRGLAGWGEIKVLEKVTGYKKIKFFTHENAGYGDVHLPEMQMHTASAWLTLPDALIDDMPHPRADVVDALRGVGYALETLATLALMCDRRDLNLTLGDGTLDGGLLPDGTAPGRDYQQGHSGGLNPTVYLFDAQPGGVGLAERIYERLPELLHRVRHLLTTCGCKQGCPACVGPGASPLRKPLALELLAHFLVDEPTPACLEADTRH